MKVDRTVTAGSTAFLTTADVCEMLRVSRQTLYRWRRGIGADDFPAPRVHGGGVRYRREDLELWLASRPAA
jgi:excisionase family DNA binding protein